MPTEGQGAATFLRAKASVVETDEIQQEETDATDETPHAHTYTHAPLGVDSCTNQVRPCHCRQNPGRVSTTAPCTPCPPALGAPTGDSGRPLQRRQPRRDLRHHGARGKCQQGQETAQSSTEKLSPSSSLYNGRGLDPRWNFCRDGAHVARSPRLSPFQLSWHPS